MIKVLSELLCRPYMSDMTCKAGLSFSQGALVRPNFGTVLASHFKAAAMYTAWRLAAMVDTHGGPPAGRQALVIE